MKKVIVLSFIGAFIDAISIIIFVYFSKQNCSELTKDLVIIFFVLSKIILFITANIFLSLKSNIVLSFFLALASVIVYEIIGFVFFRGLVKDLILFSIAHLRTTIMFFVFMSFCYLAVMAIVGFVRKRIRWKINSKRS